MIINTIAEREFEKRENKIIEKFRKLIYSKKYINSLARILLGMV